MMEPERIDLLILARLAGPGKKPPTEKDVRESLHRFVEARWSAAEWRAHFDERVAALRERGDLAPGRLAITEAGRARVAAALGVDPVPDWATLKGWILPALALELAPGAPWVRERLKATDLPGVVLQRVHELPGSRTPTLLQAVDRLAWRQLGVDTDRPLTINDVRRHLLAQLLDGGSRLPLKKLVPVLAANAVGARRPSADAMREALVRRWLEGAPDATSDHASEMRAGDADRAEPGVPAVPGSPAGPRGQAVPAPFAEPEDQTLPVRIARPSDQTLPVPVGVENALPATAAPPPAVFDLAGFARAVQAAADREQEGRFGTRKVFISAVWRRLRDTPASMCTDMALDTFKRHLVDANRADLLGLHRADLVPLMDPAEVRASEITYGNATFHFIESPFVRR
ncbi:MAG TPA: hypothetical protein VNM90_25380 [Haliangium sp.]|nr:hypothetical protein [Haliangium sp.]